MTEPGAWMLEMEDGKWDDYFGDGWKLALCMMNTTLLFFLRNE